MQESGTYELTLILGAATLLLWGVRMARTGVMRMYGPEIHRALPRALRLCPVQGRNEGCRLTRRSRHQRLDQALESAHGAW